MTQAVEERLLAAADTVGGKASRQSPSFPPRLVPSSWPATELSHRDALAMVMSPPITAIRAAGQHKHATGARLLLDWLASQPGQTWQDRWMASGADAAGAAWREVPGRWLNRQDGDRSWRREALVEAVPVAISADLLRPSLHWLVNGGPARGGLLARTLTASRDPAGFARLHAHCQADPRVSAVATGVIRYRAVQIAAAKGGGLAQIAVGDLLELFDAEDDVKVSGSGARGSCYRVLHELGVFGLRAPLTLRALRTTGPRSPDELIDRYRLTCRPIRDLLVDYLRERQPALDHTSLESLAYYLGKRFWADIELHHPGIATLNLPRAVADGWKQRLRTTTRKTRTANGETVERTGERINYRECLTPVRAFYLDLAHWAVDDPARWARWVAPCPVGEEEINRKKAKRQLKARMDARTRERLPALPALVAALDRRRKKALALLQAARDTAPGQRFTVDDVTLIRSVVDGRAITSRTWVDHPANGARRDLAREEDHAFWSWAIAEVLRATGVRVEELVELSHHSLVQYRLPATGELIPLLQIAPSKTDAERLLPVD